MDQWFLFHLGQVKGPFSTNQVEALSEAKESLIWGRELPEWVHYSQWLRWVKNPTSKSSSTYSGLSRKWKALLDQEEAGPFTYNELIDYLKNKDDVKNAQIWTEGYKDWQPIFVFHKLMDDLKIGRRAHPRVPISGRVKIRSLSDTQEGRLVSISEGGLGVADVTGLQTGDDVQLQIHSQDFFQPLLVSGEIVYVDPQQLTGIKFTRISAETKSTIIEYVHNYLKKHPVL